MIDVLSPALSVEWRTDDIAKLSCRWSRLQQQEVYDTGYFASLTHASYEDDCHFHTCSLLCMLTPQDAVIRWTHGPLHKLMPYLLLMDPKINCYNLTKNLSVLSEILDTWTSKQINKNWRIIFEKHDTMHIWRLIVLIICCCLKKNYSNFPLESNVILWLMNILILTRETPWNVFYSRILDLKLWCTLVTFLTFHSSLVRVVHGSGIGPVLFIIFVADLHTFLLIIFCLNMVTTQQL